MPRFVVCSGRAGLAAIWSGGGHAVIRAVEAIRERLSFALRGFDRDNGSKFLNVGGLFQASGGTAAWSMRRTSP